MNPLTPDKHLEAAIEKRRNGVSRTSVNCSFLSSVDRYYSTAGKLLLVQHAFSRSAKALPRSTGKIASVSRKRSHVV